MKRSAAVMGALVASAVIAVSAAAQEQSAGGLSAEAIAKANNPLADMNAINLQNYYLPSLYGVDGNSNTLNLRGVMVAGRQIIRATLPVSTVPTSEGAYASGLGDLNVFDAILLNPADSRTQFGVGPLFVFPTQTDDALGAKSTWQAGVAVVTVRSLAGGSLVGALATWQTDFAGGDERLNTNLATAQIFLTMSIGRGWYFRSSPLSVLDFENDRYLVPFGLGAGKAFPLGSAVANAFVEPQFTIYHKGAGQPAFQVFTGLNLQFASKK